MTDEYEFSCEIWEDFISLIERLDARNRLIDYDDPDMNTPGAQHLEKRKEWEKDLVTARDKYAETFDNVIAEHDPDTNLERIDRHVENINKYTAVIYGDDEIRFDRCR